MHLLQGSSNLRRAREEVENRDVPVNKRYNGMPRTLHICKNKNSNWTDTEEVRRDKWACYLDMVFDGEKARRRTRRGRVV